TIAAGSDQPGVPLLTLRGGLGEFRSPIPAALAASAQSATGLPAAELQLVCVGSQVPTPDWGAYLQDAANIPTQCTGGGSGPLAASRRDNRFGQVLLLDSKLGSRSAAASFSANGITRGGIVMSASYTWTASRDQGASSERGGQSGFAGQTAGLDPNKREWARS